MSNQSFDYRGLRLLLIAAALVIIIYGINQEQSVVALFLVSGFPAFLLHYVRNLGPVMAAIPAVLLALLQLGMGPAALTAAGYLVIGFTLGNVVELTRIRDIAQVGFSL